MTRTVGVEEELLLVDAASGEARALSSAVLAIAEKDAVGESAFEPELHRQQLEFSTHPCADMGELAASVHRWRAEAVRHGGPSPGGGGRGGAPPRAPRPPPRAARGG
ncbi:glutamate-cysteine ligase family protein, partial [Streptomyces anulatus]|uniref:glutamate-cysteine ligase family protein n=1 Tax=Streptomyces anulatus TaxID=1892 RepID=UPI0036641085